MKDDALDQEAKNRYILLYSKQPAARPAEFSSVSIPSIGGGNNKTNNTPQYELVERNKQASFFAINGQISQDNKQIGSYEERTDLANGKTYKTFTIKLKNGTVVAEAKGEGVAPNTYEVFSHIDRRTSLVTVRFNTAPLNDIAKYLTDNRYL